MKTPFLITVLICLIQALNAQIDSTYTTDSSEVRIRTNIHRGTRWVTEQRFGQDKIYSKRYNKEGFLVYEQQTDSAGRNILGITKCYSDSGRLELLIDNELKDWKVIDTLGLPHFKQLKLAKQRSDSVLISHFGQTFFQNNISWNMRYSDYFDRTYKNPNYPISWFRRDIRVSNPSEFILNYDIFFHGKKHNRRIQIIIDSDGDFIDSRNYNGSRREHNLGIEWGIEPNEDRTILSFTDAVKLAAKYGYKERKPLSKNCLIVWEYEDSYKTKVYNGNWRILVVEYVRDKKEVNRKNQRKREFHRVCKVYVFNPWTSEFIEKRKIQLKENDELSELLFGSGNYFQHIFGTTTDAPPISYHQRSFLKKRSKNQKKLTGVWVNEDSSQIIILKEDKQFYDFVSFDMIDSICKTDIPAYHYWLADKNKIRFFKLENERYESDREKAYYTYKVTRKKLYIKTTARKKWCKKDKNNTVYLKRKEYE